MIPSATNTLDDIPAALRVRIAYAVQALVVLEIVCIHASYLLSPLPGFNFRQATRVVWGLGGPPFTVLVMIGAALLARRTWAAIPTAAAVVAVTVFAMLEELIGIVSTSSLSDGVPLPTSHGLALLEQLVTFGFTVVCLALALALARYPRASVAVARAEDDPVG